VKERKNDIECFVNCCCIFRYRKCKVEYIKLKIMKIVLIRVLH